jgi:putative transposase
MVSSNLYRSECVELKANHGHDDHYLTVLRYVERNPLRAKLVARSQDWEWSSLKPTVRSGPDGLLTPGPIEKPSQWTRLVNGAQSEAELSSSRHSLARGAPFGNTQWQAQPPKKLGLASSLQPRGRPKNQISRMSPFAFP